MDAALGLSSEGESGPDGESGPAEAGAPSGASGPAEMEKNVTEATNSTESSPFAVLTKRMAGIAKRAREMLGGPKKNASAASSGASGSAEDAEEETDASGSSGASGPEMKSLTRTFVSDGATSTVTTVFHKSGEADADGKVWGAVKKLEKEHGKMKAEIDGGKSTIQNSQDEPKQQNSSGADSSGTSGATTPVDKKLKALEEELYGKKEPLGSNQMPQDLTPQIVEVQAHQVPQAAANQSME